MTRPSSSGPTGTSTISPVRLTVSPSFTRRSDPKSTTPTRPASRFMHMPLTPEANLNVTFGQLLEPRDNDGRTPNLLDQLFGLNVGHAMDTGDTITTRVKKKSAKRTVSIDMAVLFPAPSASAINDLGTPRQKKLTQPRERGPSQPGQPPPGRRGFAARGWKTPPWEMPLRRHRNGLVSRRR